MKISFIWYKKLWNIEVLETIKLLLNLNNLIFFQRGMADSRVSQFKFTRVRRPRAAVMRGLAHDRARPRGGARPREVSSYHTRASSTRDYLDNPRIVPLI